MCVCVFGFTSYYSLNQRTTQKLALLRIDMSKTVHSVITTSVVTKMDGRF